MAPRWSRNRHWLPAALVVAPFGLASIAWLAPVPESGVIGFTSRAVPSPSALLLWALLVAGVAVSVHLGFQRGLERGPYRRVGEIPLDRLQRASTWLGLLGVGAVYYQATGGAPAALVGLWRARAFYRLSDNYIDYSPGVTTLRYLVVLAGGIAVARTLSGRRIRPLDGAAVLGALALGLAASRLSLLMTCAVAATILATQNEFRPRPKRVACLAVGLVVLLGGATVSRSGDSDIEFGLTSPTAIATTGIQGYLAVPIDVSIQYFNAVADGRATPAGDFDGFFGPLIPPYLQRFAGSFIAEDVVAVPDVEARYGGAVNLSRSLTTNGIVTDGLALYGWIGLSSIIASMALMAWAAARLLKSGPVGAALAGVYLYSFVESWRVFLGNTGLVHATTLLVVALALGVGERGASKADLGAGRGRQRGGVTYQGADGA